MRNKRIGATMIAALLTVSMLSSASNASCFRGINLSGAEFGDRNGVYGQKYAYPSKDIIAYYAIKGMNTVRLPFLWEHLQPKLNGPRCR